MTVIQNDNANPLVIWSRLAFVAGAGRTYQIVADGYGPNSGGPLMLHMWLSNTVPVITAPPQSQWVDAGATATFSVTASGTGSSYAWRFNGTNLAGATYARTNAQVAHPGFYDVVVSNASGTVASAPAVLFVREPPSFLATPATQILDVGGNASFGGVATAIPPATYQWTYNGVPLPGAFGTNSTRVNLQYADGGTYALSATNAAGSATASAELIVRPLVTGIGITTNGVVQVPYSGTPGKTYALERTAEFPASGGATWTTITTLTTTAVPALMTDTNNPGASQRFYRIRLAQ